MCLPATFALKAQSQSRKVWLWLATGAIAGLAVLFRPDSGLFAAAIGITLVVATLSRAGDLQLTNSRDEKLHRVASTSYLGAVFSLAFCLVLVPWAVRNYRVFHVFQPLAPAHAEMPGEFVPRGYLRWVRTWINDGRYVGPALWSLDSAAIKLTDYPDSAFDSAEEKQRVSKLLEQYNSPNKEPQLFVDQVQPTPDASPDEADDSKSGDESDKESDKESDSDEPDDETQADDTEPADATSDQAVEMTPQIDAGFAQLAQERIAHHPFRYYVLLPLKRAHALWFNTHSDYYPFEGELLPMEDLDYSGGQQYWLPLFAFLVLAYSLLGIAGGWFLWEANDSNSRLWLLLVVLIIFLRIGFFATLENPEPRYVVEVFPFLTVLGGMSIARIKDVVAGWMQKRSRPHRER